MRILLAMDGSETALGAARFLTRLPLGPETQITVVTGVTDTPVGEIDVEVWMRVRESARQMAGQHYQSALQQLGGLANQAEHVLAEGHPNRVILDVAKQRDVDLIVLGARGHSMIARTLLGSTSDYVANHARCPVLVVRPASVAPNKTGPLRIVLAYDGSAGSKVAAQQLFAFPWSAQTQVQITTLLERPHLLADEEIYDAQAIASGEQSLKQLVDGASCSANISYRVRETTHVGDSLAHLADEELGDLIVVGETGRSALAQFFLGSAARHILHHSVASVWIARNKKW